jgi:DNA adenine methylase
MAPALFARYHEPFLGGGAVFFWLADARGVREASLNDLNKDLIEAYSAVRDTVEPLIAELADLATRYLAMDAVERAEFYYTQRATMPLDPVRRTARLIFLNKTCFNGLYRVNRSGLFNVPHGDYTRPRILDAEVLRACSRSLNRVQLSSLDFEEACEAAKPGDFVYLDPPYQPLSATSRFTSYTKSDFDYSNQLRLADVFARLTQRGVVAVLSNSDHPDVERLYKQFTIRRVPMARSINSDGCGRAAITELLISNAEIVQERSASPK